MDRTRVHGLLTAQRHCRTAVRNSREPLRTSTLPMNCISKSTEHAPKNITVSQPTANSQNTAYSFSRPKRETRERETALTPDPQFHCLARDPKYCGLAGTTGNVAPRKTNWLALGGNDTRCSVYKRRTHPAALWLIIVQRWACNFRV